MNLSKSVHKVIGCAGYEIDDIAGTIGEYVVCISLFEFESDASVF